MHPEERLIHLVCACGALVSVPPGTGARSVPCRSCGMAVEVPDTASLRLEAGPAPVVPAPIPANRPPVPAPLPPPTPARGYAPPPVHSPALPAFDTDERLNLWVLEREAARLGVMGRLVIAAGLVGALGAALIPGRIPAERVLLAAAVLFVAVAGWSGIRAARASCLASVALAQRQREILRGLSHLEG